MTQTTTLIVVPEVRGCLITFRLIHPTKSKYPNYKDIDMSWTSTTPAINVASQLNVVAAKIREEAIRMEKEVK
jgi:hypothetical protein